MRIDESKFSDEMIDVGILIEGNEMLTPIAYDIDAKETFDGTFRLDIAGDANGPAAKAQHHEGWDQRISRGTPENFKSGPG